MRHKLISILLFTTISFGIANIIFGQTSDRLSVLLVTGSDVLKYQISLVHTDFYSLLSSHNDIEWDHATSDEGAFYSDISDKYDVLLLFNFNDRLSRNAKINLAKYFESGKGIICFHSHLASYNDWDWWWQNVTGAKYQYHEIGGMEKSGYKQKVPIKFIKAADHPITNSVGEFEVIDEVYSRLYFADGIEVLYKTDNPASDEPIVWIGPNKKSRVVSIVQGHGPEIYSDENFRTLFYESVKWAGEREKL